MMHNCAPGACRTMVTQLIQHERIETTLPKAKELSRYADSCITLAKKVCQNRLLVIRDALAPLVKARLKYCCANECASTDATDAGH